MCYRWLCVSLTILAIIASAASVGAEEPTPPSDTNAKTYTIVTSAAASEVRDYSIDFKLAGNQANAAIPSATVSLKIRHLYSRRVGDDLLPMEISLQQGTILTQQQALDITPSLYPRLSVLIDNRWRVADVLGAAGSRFAQGTPGLNYGNLIIVFYLVDGDKPRAVGDTWNTSIKLPSIGQEFSIVNTLRGVETVNGVEAARVSQKITLVPKTSANPGSKMTAEAESLFALKNGKLLKSHVECLVEAPPDTTTSSTAGTKTAPSERTNVKIDIASI